MNMPNTNPSLNVPSSPARSWPDFDSGSPVIHRSSSVDNLIISVIIKENPQHLAVPGVLNGEPDDVLLSLEIQPTIIGDKAFHCPVRNGKEWDRFSMVIRQRLCPCGRILCFGKKRSTDHAHP